MVGAITSRKYTLLCSVVNILMHENDGRWSGSATKILETFKRVEEYSNMIDSQELGYLLKEFADKLQIDCQVLYETKSNGTAGRIHMFESTNILSNTYQKGVNEMENTMVIKELNLKDLRIDYSYQRQQEAPRLKKIVNNFDPDRVGVLSVSNRDGKGILYVYDGGHRRAALMSLGHETWDCHIIEASRDREAYLFDTQSEARKNLSTIDIFKSKVSRNVPECVAVNRAITNTGVEIGRGKNQITCIKACMDIYKKFGVDILEQAISFAKTTWPLDNACTERHILEGVSAMIWKCTKLGRWDYTRASLRLRKYDPFTLKTKAITARAGERGLYDAMSSVLISYLNHEVKRSAKTYIEDFVYNNSK